MLDLLRPYFMIVKLWAVIALILAVGTYIWALNHTISEQRETMRFLRSTVESCDRDRAKLRAANRFQADNIGALDAYYRTRKCLNLHEGLLTDEELSLP